METWSFATLCLSLLEKPQRSPGLFSHKLLRRQGRYVTSARDVSSCAFLSRFRIARGVSLPRLGKHPFCQSQPSQNSIFRTLSVSYDPYLPVATVNSSLDRFR